mmetsp:Transcript_31616/g.90265  ORF Transcript_31616/g.90265 Transcript_31616/m.90265 type:complete len:217 (+) Transcript_31616:1-651(+)
MAPGCAGGCSQAASPRSSCSATRPSSGEEGSHRGAPADVRGPCRPRAFVEAVGAAAAPDASSAPLDATSEDAISEEGVAARDFCAGHPCRRREARRSPEEGLSQGARAPAARRFRRSPPRACGAWQPEAPASDTEGRARARGVSRARVSRASGSTWASASRRSCTTRSAQAHGCPTRASRPPSSGSSCSACGGAGGWRTPCVWRSTAPGRPTSRPS